MNRFNSGADAVGQEDLTTPNLMNGFWKPFCNLSDIKEMENSKTELITAAIVLILLISSGLIHLPKKNNSTGTIPRAERCIGVFHPAIGKGLLFPSDSDNIIDVAKASFLIPDDCHTAFTTQDLESTSQIIFRETDGGCVVDRIQQLSQAEHILCGDPMNLNQAGEEDLVLLPGIGPERARQIIELRQEEGPFTTVDDLMRIRGIGPKTVEKAETWLEW
jgi:comEA protein